MTKMNLPNPNSRNQFQKTRVHQGYLRYDPHQNNDAPNHFVFYEPWISRALWGAQMEPPHLATYAAVTKDAVDLFTLHELTHIA